MSGAEPPVGCRVGPICDSRATIARNGDQTKASTRAASPSRSHRGQPRERLPAGVGSSPEPEEGSRMGRGVRPSPSWAGRAQAAALQARFLPPSRRPGRWRGAGPQ